MQIPYNDIIVVRSKYYDDVGKYNKVKQLWCKLNYSVWKGYFLNKVLPTMRKNESLILKQDIKSFLVFLSAITGREDTNTLKVDNYEFNLNSLYEPFFYITEYRGPKSVRCELATLDSHEDQGKVLFDFMFDVIERYIKGEQYESI